MQRPSAASSKRFRSKTAVVDETDPRATYQFGWCREISLPFRLRHGAPPVEMELAMPVEIEPTQRGTDPVMGVWRDGMRHPIADISCDMWKVLSSSRSSRQDGAKNLWEGERANTHHKLVLAQRVDRQLLVSLYEQQRQVLQLRADRWGPLPGRQPCIVPDTDETLRKVVEFALPLVQAYAAGSLATVADLKAARDEKMKAEGVCAKTLVIKRPAAAIASGGSDDDNLPDVRGGKAGDFPPSSPSCGEEQVRNAHRGEEKAEQARRCGRAVVSRTSTTMPLPTPRTFGLSLLEEASIALARIDA